MSSSPSSSSSFHGFDQPCTNFFRIPNDFIKITEELKGSELRVLLYIFRHTWGFSEFDVFKRITIEEFMNGRRRKNGSRIDHGCGVTKKQSIVQALRTLESKGLIIVRTDDKDKARSKKSYKIRMKTEEDDCQNEKNNTEIGDCQSENHSVSPEFNTNSDNGCVKKNNKTAKKNNKRTNLGVTKGNRNEHLTSTQKGTAEVTKGNRRGHQREPRSEKETNRKKGKEKNTSSLSDTKNFSTLFVEEQVSFSTHICRRLVERLFHALSRNDKITRSPKLKDWATEFKKFIQESNVSPEEFKLVLDWYCKNCHLAGRSVPPFVPAAYSAKTFCDKFVKIKESRIRFLESGNPEQNTFEAEPIPVVSKDDLEEKRFNVIVNDMESVGIDDVDDYRSWMASQGRNGGIPFWDEEKLGSFSLHYIDVFRNRIMDRMSHT